MRTRSAPEPQPELVQTTDDFHHVRVRPEGAFAEFRTPLAADTTASTVVEGCDVRKGRVGPDRWVVESVLIPLDAVDDGAAAEQLAGRIVDRLES